MKPTSLSDHTIADEHQHRPVVDSRRVVRQKATLKRRPLYQHVYDLLMKRIAERVWKPNAPMPSEEELSREMGVSLGTIRKALNDLKTAGLVVRLQGRGTYVVDQSTASRAARFDRLRNSEGERFCGTAVLVEQSSALSSDEERSRLRLEPGANVIRTRRLLRDDHGVYAVEVTCLPTARFRNVLPENVGDYDLPTLAQRCGEHVQHFIESIELERPPPDIAAHLSLEPGSTVMKLDRVMLSPRNDPLEWRIVYCNSTKCVYVCGEAAL